jgi:hypothetical protein
MHAVCAWDEQWIYIRHIKQPPVRTNDVQIATWWLYWAEKPRIDFLKNMNLDRIVVNSCTSFFYWHDFLLYFWWLLEQNCIVSWKWIQQILKMKALPITAKKAKKQIENTYWKLPNFFPLKTMYFSVWPDPYVMLSFLYTHNYNIFMHRLKRYTLANANEIILDACPSGQ